MIQSYRNIPDVPEQKYSSHECQTEITIFDVISKVQKMYVVTEFIFKYWQQQILLSLLLFTPEYI